MSILSIYLIGVCFSFSLWGGIGLILEARRGKDFNSIISGSFTISLLSWVGVGWLVMIFIVGRFIPDDFGDN